MLVPTTWFWAVFREGSATAAVAPRASARAIRVRFMVVLLSCSWLLRIEGVAGGVVVDDRAAVLVGGRFRRVGPRGHVVLRGIERGLGNRGGGGEGKGN